MKTLTVVVAALSILSAPLCAGMDSELKAERAAAQAQQKALIMQAMSLDEGTSKVFWPLYDAYQAEKAKINDQTATLIEDYAMNYKTMTDPVAMTLVNKMVDLQVQKVTLKAESVKKFAKVLPGRVVARYFQADNKIDAALSASIANQIPLVPTDQTKALVPTSAPQK